MAQSRINRDNIAPNALLSEAEIQRDAMRYLRAHYFLQDLYRHKDTVLRPQMKMLRDQAKKRPFAILISLFVALSIFQPDGAVPS